MRQARYVIDRAKQVGGPVSVFLVNGRLRVMDARDAKTAQLMNDPFFRDKCLGTYRHDCKESVIEGDIREKDAAWWEVEAF